MNKLVFALALTAGSAFAVEVSDVSGLVAAFQAVNAGTETVITVSPGSYDLSGVSMDADAHLLATKTFTLEGSDTTSWRETQDNRTKVIFDAKGVNRILRIANDVQAPHIKGITFLNGIGHTHSGGDSYTDTYARGGAVSHGISGAGPAGWDEEGKRAVLTNCVVETCSAMQGGAVYCCNLEDVQIKSCTSTSSGGALMYGSAYGSVFDSCHSGGEGGACYTIWNADGNVFKNNSSDMFGGAIYNLTSMIVSNCAFTNNTANGIWYGGAIATTADYTVRAYDCIFSGNKAARGGALYCVNIATNCLFVGNTAVNYGGAMYGVTRENSVVESCKFVENVASEDSGNMGEGGALYDCKNVTNCRFERNRAYDGGAVALSSVSNSAFTANESTYAGGAGYNANFTDCDFNVNTSLYGAAIHYGVGASGRTEYCRFTDGYARSMGGVSWCQDRSSVFGHCYFTNNVGAGYTGGIVGGTIGNCEFYHCKADLYAGVWQSKVSDSKFIGTVKTGDSYFGGGDGRDSDFERCEFTGGPFENAGGQLANCSAVDCHFHHFTNLWCGVFYDVNYITNCLVSDCSDVHVFYHSQDGGVGDRRSQIVNCTIANIDMPNWESALFYVNWGGASCNYDLVNTLIYNIVSKGSRVDLSCHSAGVESITGVTLQNCLYGVDAGSLPWTDKGGNVQELDPKFVGGLERYGDVPFYSIRRGSKARNAGLNAPWMESATDLAGNGRMNEGVVDIGCYECWLKACGLAIVVR